MMRALSFIVIGALALGYASAGAQGLSPAGPSTSSRCYASGTSGPTVPCVQDGQTWKRMLGVADPADTMTVGGIAIPAILGAKAPLASPAFSGVVTAPSIALTGAGSTGDISAMRAAVPGALAPVSLGDLAVAAPPIRAFGAPSGSDWSAPFAAAEAANALRVNLPPGTYSTGRKSYYHNIPYVGPGSATIVDVDGNSFPADFSQIINRPYGGTGTNYNKYFSADGRYSDRDYRIIQQGLRVGLNEPYFAPEMSKQLSIYTTYGGSSGVVSQLTAGTAVGATTVPLISTQGLSVGMKIAFSANNDTLNLTDPVTVTAINTGTNTITVSPALALAHASGDQVTNGPRTMQSRGHYEMTHGGYGDGAINVYRVIGASVPLPGQTHVFWTATAGIDGGDISATTDGQYFTGREVHMNDNSKDIAYAYDVVALNRLNDTGARGAFWVNNLAQSIGTKAADANMVMSGKFRVGFDTTGADLTASGGAALNLASGHGILWDSQRDTSERFSIWGKIYGKTWTGIETGEWKLKRPNAGTQVDAVAVTDGGQVRQPRKPMVVAEGRSNITLSASFTALALTSVYDALGDYNASNGRFTCRAPGRYRIHARVLMDAGTAGSTGAQVSIYKNGTIAIGGDGYIVQAFNPLASGSGETILQCNLSDYFEVRAKDAGNAGGVVHGGPATAFTIEYLG